MYIRRWIGTDLGGDSEAYKEIGKDGVMTGACFKYYESFGE